MRDGYFYKDELSAYAEYGLNERITLVGRFAWQTVRRGTSAGEDAAQGFAASEIGLRRVIWQAERQVWSGQVTALFPGAGENVSNRPLGVGGHAVDLRSLWGRSIGQTGFVEVQAAWRWREAPDLDEVRLDLTAGWRPAKRWQVIAQSYSVWSLEPGRPGAPEFHQHRLALSVGRHWRGKDYFLGVYATPAGRNAIIERAVFFSVWQTF
ncbi:hypothetical protein [Maricaulis sp. CAU 1757]